MSGNGSPGGLLTDEMAETRRIITARFTALRANMGSESGDKGGGGNKEITEALLLAAMGAALGRTGLGNKEVLGRAAVHGALRKRRAQSRGEAFFPEESVGYSPNVALAGVGLARRADARMVAQALGVEVARVRQVQRDLGVKEMDGVLRADYHTGVIEQAARANLWHQGPGGPETPPEQVWRLALAEGTDLSRMEPRDLAQGWLSAANSHEPGARDAQERFFEALSDKHPQIAESIERHTVKDVNFVGDPHSSRIDANSVMSAASPQANGRPMQTMEEAWNKAIPAMKDPRSDPHQWRDAIESLVTAVQDGRAPGASVLDAINDAKGITGFAQSYDKGLKRAEARLAKGDPHTFPQGEALLYGLDQHRGFPTNDPRDRAQDTRVINAGGAALRSQDPAAAVATDPRLLLGEGAGLHKSAGQVKLGHERLGASGVVRPDVALAKADGLSARAANSNGSADVRYPQGARARAEHRDGQGARVGRVERDKLVAAGNKHSGDQRRDYHDGASPRTVRGDSRLARGKEAPKAQARLMAAHKKHRRVTTTTVTTTTRRGAAR
jgi:hypothetical protein